MKNGGKCMSLFTCNITKEKYDFAEYNLKDLAKIIKEQYQLTNQKILSYFKNLGFCILFYITLFKNTRFFKKLFLFPLCAVFP